MDPFSDILNLLAARSYATAGLSAGKHWAMAFPGYHGLKFIFIKEGAFWFRLETENEWQYLSAGEGVILTRSVRFIMATDVGCSPVESTESRRPRVRETVNYGGDENLLLAGKMEIDLASSDILLKGLPLVIHFDTHSEQNSPLSTLMNLFFNEKISKRPGATQACNYLMHLIMIEVLRNGTAESQNGRKGILHIFYDFRINKALSAIHQEPEINWSLNELANISGMSRSGFSQKFKEITGITPLIYLTNWRMRIASKQLRFTRNAVKVIGYSLGYTSESTFSTAFKRVYGIAPRAYRDHYSTEIQSESN